MTVIRKVRQGEEGAMCRINTGRIFSGIPFGAVYYQRFGTVVAGTEDYDLSAVERHQVSPTLLFSS